jgi:hypothetical protein
MVSPGRGALTVLRDLSRSCPIYAAVREGSNWSARSRAAARTNELDADERRRIIGSEEEPFPVWLYEGSCAVPGVWQAEWSRKHPSGAAPVSRRGAMTMCPGTGLLSQMIERGRWAGSCRRSELARGLVTLPVSVGVVVVVPASLVAAAAPGAWAAAWAAASRW